MKTGKEGARKDRRKRERERILMVPNYTCGKQKQHFCTVFRKCLDHIKYVF